MDNSLITVDPETLGGTPVFKGTRVPVRSLFDHLEAGDSIEDFLEGFPSVKREQVIAILEASCDQLLHAAVRLMPDREFMTGPSGRTFRQTTA